MHIVNVSQKEISAIDVSLSALFPGASTYGVDLLEGIVQGKGGLAPGGVYDLEVPGQPGESPAQGIVDMVIYVDGTADVLNTVVFKGMVLRRKGDVLAMQKANELMTKALADPTDQHPSATVAGQLKALAYRLQTDKNKNPDDPASYEGAGLLVAAQDANNVQRDATGRSDTEDSSLRQLIKYHEERISLMLPHTVVGQGVRH
jgi:hypothetical protein